MIECLFLGCPEFKKPASLDEKDVAKPKLRGRKRNVGEMIKEATEQEKYYLGQ